MSGKELSERVAAVRPALPVLYMSGYSGRIMSRHGVLEGGMQFVEKPFTLKTLTRKIRGILGGGVWPRD